jgi:hypothetical protein
MQMTEARKAELAEEAEAAVQKLKDHPKGLPNVDARQIVWSAKAARDVLALEKAQQEIKGANWNAQRMGLDPEVRKFLTRWGHAAGTGLTAVRTLKRKGPTGGRRSRRARKTRRSRK